MQEGHTIDCRHCHPLGQRWTATVPGVAARKSDSDTALCVALTRDDVLQRSSVAFYFAICKAPQAGFGQNLWTAALLSLQNKTITIERKVSSVESRLYCTLGSSYAAVASAM